MKRAIEQILSDAMGYKKAAQTYMVPQSTLEDRIKKMKNNGLSLEEASLKGMEKYKCVFSKEQEIELQQKDVTVGLNVVILHATIGHMRVVRDGLKTIWTILSVKLANPSVNIMLPLGLANSIPYPVLPFLTYGSAPAKPYFEVF
ncbi:hypothetical protein RN001_001323 [Aquatica leii]|uniref:HTH psq-type domain-containing protein n=1 Tax=Aquatica leii TaxID=1421715 RepID=A0AAN7Q7S9_9COLE|nr:hypothetical protein RN001_001323 [Aquatica leii]